MTAWLVAEDHPQGWTPAAGVVWLVLGVALAWVVLAVAWLLLPPGFDTLRVSKVRRPTG